MAFKNIRLLELFIIFAIIAVLYNLASNLYNDYRYEFKLKLCKEEINLKINTEDIELKKLKIKECIEKKN